MFRRIDNHEAPAVRLELDGEAVEARQGDMLSAVLLSHPNGYCRTTAVTGAKRAPYCLMGVCFDCLIEVDGQPNQQACMIPAREGMRVKRMTGAARFEETAE